MLGDVSDHGVSYVMDDQGQITIVKPTEVPWWIWVGSAVALVFFLRSFLRGR